MREILLVTLNARYAHASFALRYLQANLGDLQGTSRIVEFDISQRTLDIAEAILAHQPRILALGVYIWNARESLALAAALKRLCPDLILVLGGPEVSHETEQQPIAALADFIITGEADLAFARLCRELLSNRRPLQKIICAELPDLAQLALPYDLYDDEDLAHRVVYVEASRGCPFRCEFCLSSLDVSLRAFPLERFLDAMQRLLDRGLNGFKFVDRTFNLNIATSSAILEFFLSRYRPGLFLHFEMIPDRLPEPLRELLARFPAGAVQIEVGVQTFNEEVAARISRRQDNALAEENLRFLRNHTGVHIHADLIAGLPGEDLAGFARGFDWLIALGPHEIQVGILKRLRGTPITRHDAEFAMLYSPEPPYELLRNNLLDFATMQKLRRLARYFDLVRNSGRFPRASDLLLRPPSPFDCFWRFSEWLFARVRRAHAIAADRLGELIFDYLIGPGAIAPETAASALWEDLAATGRPDVPPYLRPHLRQPLALPARRGARSAPPRQRRHH